MYLIQMNQTWLHILPASLRGHRTTPGWEYPLHGLSHLGAGSLCLPERAPVQKSSATVR